jgi:hypothetical protein
MPHEISGGVPHKECDNILDMYSKRIIYSFKSHWKSCVLVKGVHVFVVIINVNYVLKLMTLLSTSPVNFINSDVDKTI